MRAYGFDHSVFSCTDRASCKPPRRMAHGGLLPPILQSRLQATFPDYQSRILTMARPFVWRHVATMLRLVIMGAKERSLAAGSA